MKKRLMAVLIASICIVSSILFSCSNNAPIVLKDLTNAKNVILLIGDGMGPNQIKAGEIASGKKLYMQNFPYNTKVETRSYSNEVTDSAAAGTALATGNRVVNGQIGISPDGQELTTIMDIAKSLGKRTGVITTEEIYGATPMAFLSHAPSRDNKALLIEGAANSGVNLISSFIIGSEYINTFTEAGYERIENPDDISESSKEFVFGSYRILAECEYGECTKSSVSLDRLVTEALNYLSKDEDGFVLMAEGAHIDHGGHNNDFNYMLEELLAFDNAVRAVLEWAKGRDDTVVLVTADHETGGLWVNESATAETLFDTESNPPYLPTPKNYKWTTKDHTSTDVFLFVNGSNVNFSKFEFGSSSRIKNIDVFNIMKELLGAN